MRRPMNTARFSEGYGRLGNQLFQVGLLFAIEQHRGHRFYLPHHGEGLWSCFDLDVPSKGPDCRHGYAEAEGTCTFDPWVFHQPRGTRFEGYFQSDLYLEDCKPALVRWLRFRAEHEARCEALLDAYQRRFASPLVSLHVRRGDYVLDEARWGDLAADGYYDRAVEAIGTDAAYLVFSDDLPWCRLNLKLERAEFVDADPYVSLCLMTRCDLNVIANSSFSWWGAYLNPNDQVYAPNRWFEPAMRYAHLDILPPHWRTISVYGEIINVGLRGA